MHVKISVSINDMTDKSNINRTQWISSQNYCIDAYAFVYDGWHKCKQTLSNKNVNILWKIQKDSFRNPKYFQYPMVIALKKTFSKSEIQEKLLN